MYIGNKSPSNLAKVVTIIEFYTPIPTCTDTQMYSPRADVMNVTVFLYRLNVLGRQWYDSLDTAVNTLNLFLVK
jgi:hypothetical protein